MQNDSEIAEKLNEFFTNAVSTLGITENSFIINEEYSSDSVQRAIVKFESHPSISLIKNKITNRTNFKFEPLSLSYIGVFLDNLKFAEVTSVFKKDDPFFKKTTDSVLPTISKIYEQIIFLRICEGKEKMTTANKLWFLS